jgi:cell division protein FtsZ
MPQIEDLPLPVQQQIRAQRGEAPAESPTETRRRTLLERLASFGMSRQDEAQHAPQVPALPAAPRLAQQPARLAPAPVHHEYARRPAAPAPAPAPAPRQVQLDPHGRATPVVRSSEDDHLPAPPIELISTALCLKGPHIVAGPFSLRGIDLRALVRFCNKA